MNRLTTTLNVNSSAPVAAGFAGLDDFLSGVTTPHIGIPNGTYVATIKELAAVEGIAALKITVFINGAAKNSTFRVFDTNKFITEFALANGYAIHSLNEAVGKTMPLNVLDGKYSILPHMPEVGTHIATFQGLGSINLGKERAAIYFKWEVNSEVFYDFTMYTKESAEKIDRKISDIARSFGITDSFMRADLNNYVGKTMPVYIVTPEGLKSKFINYWKKPEEVMPEVAVDIVKF